MDCALCLAFVNSALLWFISAWGSLHFMSAVLARFEKPERNEMTSLVVFWFLFVFFVYRQQSVQAVFLRYAAVSLTVHLLFAELETSPLSVTIPISGNMYIYAFLDGDPEYGVCVSLVILLCCCYWCLGDRCIPRVSSVFWREQAHTIYLYYICGPTKRCIQWYRQCTSKYLFVTE